MLQIARNGETQTVQWSRELLDEYAAEVGVEPTPEFASSWLYGQANLHSISEFMPGELWDCCPRSYAEFSPLATRVAAADIIEAAQDVNLEMPATWILGGAQPSARTKGLVRMALAVMRAHHAERLRGDA